MKKLILISLLIISYGLSQNKDSEVIKNDPNKKWSISLGHYTTKGLKSTLTRYYNVGKNTRLYIAGNTTSYGLGAIHEENYNNNGYVIGLFNGIDFSFSFSYNSANSYSSISSSNWRITPFIGYQWIYKSQHCFYIGNGLSISKGIHYNYTAGKKLKEWQDENKDYKMREKSHKAGFINNFHFSFFPIISYEFKFNR